MKKDEIEKIVLEEISNIAPDADVATLDPREDLREAIDLDSMDMLNLVAALHQRLGVDIPEADAGNFVTLTGAVSYLLTHLNKS